jgi:hypothetical protein
MTLSETEWNEEAQGSVDLRQGKHDTNQKTAIIKTPITSDLAAQAAPTTITFKREQRGATLNHLLTLRHLQTTMTATKWAGSAAALGASLSPRRVALHKQKWARERRRERERERERFVQCPCLIFLARTLAERIYVYVRSTVRTCILAAVIRIHRCRVKARVRDIPKIRPRTRT